jgi:hypothetical protein
MYLLYCVLSLCLAGLWFRAIMRGILYPAKPIWVNETFVLYVAAPIISGLVALVGIFGLQFIATFPPTLLECAYSVALIAAATGLDHYFSRGSRLSADSTSERAGRLIKVDFSGTGDQDTPNPARELDQGHKKAA